MGNPAHYLNAETPQEEVLEHPGDHLQWPSPLYYDRKTHQICLSSGREAPLFLAPPFHLHVWSFISQGDRACTMTSDGWHLLLSTSGLKPYMEICDLRFQPQVSHL